jgi:hypothetical protein
MLIVIQIKKKGYAMNETPTNGDDYKPEQFENDNIEPDNEESYVQPEFTPDVQPAFVPQPVFVPEVQPIITTQPEIIKPNSVSPGLIVLQWLTYAFWGWTLIATSILTLIVLTFFLVKSADVGDSTLYSMAAVLVLLPISVVCDIFYSKNEPEKKTGAASVAMIINAIIFALFGIGSVIAIVFSLVTLFVSSGNTDGTLVALYGALIIALLFGILFLRTILPKKLIKMRRYFIILMILIIGAICAFGIFGPTIEARLTRNDKLIESNLEIIGEAVNSYATKNSHLPDSLSSITLLNDAKKLVTDNLVTYKKDSAPTLATNEYSETFYYQLCVTYKKEKVDQYANTSEYSNGVDDYSDYVSAYYHPSGYYCYKLKTTNYDSSPTPIMTNTK